MALDPLFLGELNERLFVQFVGGRWTAPLGERLLGVFPFDDGRVGRLVCANAGDLARARVGLGHGRPSGLAPAYEALRPVLRDLRRAEGFDDPADPPEFVALPGHGPLVLLSAADTPVAVLAGALLAAAERGVLWKPAPGAAASAHLLMRALGPRGDGNLAMVQGDHATGALAAALGPVLWASGAPVPEGLNALATAPRRR